jgi:peptide/nickel transport system substrate-binding protein
MIIFIIIIFAGCDKDKHDNENLIYDNMHKTSYEEIIKAAIPENNPEVAINRRDTLIVGINTPNGKFNPLYANSIYDSWVCSLVFDGLTANDDKGSIIPNVAKQWAVSEDGKTYTFTLRENVKFIDGSELTAEDVAFTYTALCDPKYYGIYGNSFKALVGYRDYTEGSAKEVAGIKLINKYEIAFSFTEARASLLYDFAIGILPKKFYDFKKGDIGVLEEKLLKPIGSGAYKLNQYNIGKEILLERNPAYWKGQAAIPNITLKISDDIMNAKGVITGDIDIGRVSTTIQNVKALKEAGFLELHLYDSNGYQYIGLNLRNEMFKDKKVRQALLYGLDRKAFIDAYYGGYGTTYNIPLAKCSWAYPKEINEYGYDKEKANRLLDEAGWQLREDGLRYDKKGKKFSIKWSTYEGNKYVENLIPIVKESWKQLGVEILEERMPFSKLVEKVYDKQDFEMYNMSWILALDPDPSPIFSKEEEVPGGYNAVGWINDENDKLIKAALKEMDQEKRKEIYKEWAKLANEELPYLYINQNKELYAVNSRVKNLKLSPFIDWTVNINKLVLQ